MRLIRLALTNFRQHVDTVLDFRPGLTGIIGPNGAGKSTILEAIAWAIYGTQAVRGKVDSLRFNRAPGRSPVRVVLEFELNGELHRVSRTPRNAELFRADEEAPIAAGISEVTRQLNRRLGMNRDEFFNTYFTGQKELQFLAAMKPNERRLFLSQVLGYERLRHAQTRAREQRKVLKGQIEELRRNLGDPEQLARAVEEAESRLSEATQALAVTEAAQVEAATRFAELEPTWARLQSERDRDRQLHEELRIAQTRLEAVDSTMRKAEAELSELAAVGGELEKLQEAVTPLAGLSVEEEKLRGLADAASRRAALEKQLVEQRQRVETLSQKETELETAAGTFEDLKATVETRDEECSEMERQRDEARSNWQRDQQDVDARLRMLREQADDLKKQIKQIEAAGPDGVCPACQRPLGAEFDRVLGELREQFAEVVDAGKWHKKRLEQLKAEPADVLAVDANLSEARRNRDQLRTELAAAEAARGQAAVLGKELEAEKTRARTLAGEIAALAEGYDSDRYDQVRRDLERLRDLEKKVAQLEARLEAGPRLKAHCAEAEEQARQIRAQISEVEASRAELDFSEEEFASVGGSFESARAALDHARLAAERARGELEAARSAADAARGAEEEHRKVARVIGEREREQRLHNELDSALGALRDELNDRVRPELSEIASVFLTELTDGRYNQIEISPEYTIVVLDDGEEKPVISGGEEDLANLVLRLAISQMIADRAGQALSLLVFDEVFGSLDDQRRESVVRLLQKLQDRFEQVVLITHIESIHEGMDQVVRVEYDESSGASVIREESPGASGESLEPVDLAALVSE